ncbi:hypothetical protein ACFQ3Z_40065 [Streptomyces nogalater]
MPVGEEGHPSGRQPQRADTRRAAPLPGPRRGLVRVRDGEVRRPGDAGLPQGGQHGDPGDRRVVRQRDAEVIARLGRAPPPAEHGTVEVL